MSTWLQRLVDNVLANIIAALLIGGGLAVLSIVKDAPAYVVALVILGGIGLTLWILNQLRVLRRRTRPVEFYPDRTAMIRERGGLDNEARQTPRLCVAFESGAHFNTMSADLIRKIDRLIVLNPDDPTTQRLAELYAQDHAGQFMANILPAVRRAKASDIAVRVARGPIMNVVLGDPDGPNAWARLQIPLSHRRAADWPNIVIRRSDHPELFDKIRASYEALWQQSGVPN